MPRISTRIVVWAALLWWLALLALTFFVLRPEGAGAVLDSRVLGYSTPDVQAYLAGITEAGRWHLLHSLRVMDAIFPPLLTFALLRLMAGLRGGARGFWVLPLIYCVLDWAENQVVAGIIRSGVADDQTVALASMLTVSKYAFVGTNLLIVAAIWLRHRRVV